MQLTTLFLLAGALAFSAAAKTQVITFKGADVSLARILQVVEQQTGFVASTSEQMLRNTSPVTVEAERMPLTEFLTMVFKNQPVGFVLTDKNIILKKVKEVRPSIVEEVMAPPLKGKVVDQDGKPLQGATVSVKGKKISTSTRIDGTFSLNAGEGETITISYIGYQHIEQKITSDNIDFATIVLKASTSELDEVAVTAYGTTSKRISTTDVSVVKAKDIGRKPIGNPILALQGEVPGVNIVQQTGIPGSTIKIQIRGQNSLLNSNAPFYVVDGVPYFSKVLNSSIGTRSILGAGSTMGADVQYGSPLDFINPMDIESITILKDADATAIYGSRAANGAILITTKKGKSGPMRVNIDAMAGRGRPKFIKLLNTEQYLEMRRDAYTHDSIPIPDQLSSQKDYSNYDLTVYDPSRYTDWQKELLGNGQFSRENISVSGGNVNTQYLIGINYSRQQVLKRFLNAAPSFLKQGALHFSINSSSVDQRFNINFSGSYSDNRNSPGSDPTSIALTLAPNAPALFDKGGNLNWEQRDNVSTFINPLASLFSQRKVNNTLLASNLQASYRISNSLQFSTRTGYTRNQLQQFYGKTAAQAAPENKSSVNRNATYSAGYQSALIVEPQISYYLSKYRHTVNALFGASYQYQDRYTQELFAEGFATDLELENPMAAPFLQYNGTNFAQTKYNAAFLQFNYNYDDRYILNLNGRRDGSSRFGPNKRFKNFWSIGSAWVFTNEEWLKYNPIISFGKIRTSYGITGSDQIGDYRFLNLYYAQSYALPYQDAASYLGADLPNPNLKWEETSKWQWGLDIGLFADRVQIAANYYLNKTSNQVVAYFLPAVTGGTQVTANIPATIQNNGLEFNVSSSNIDYQDFKWRSSFNISFPRNKLLSYPGLEQSPSKNDWTIGKPVNRILLFQYAGIDPNTGLFSFYDSSGKPTSTPDANTDRTIIKPLDPMCTGGFSNRFMYKNLSLDILFSFALQEGPNYTIGSPGFPPGQFNSYASAGNQPALILKDGNHQAFYSTNYAKPDDIGPAFGNVSASTFGYNRADYIRLRSLTLSWNFIEKWIAKTKMQNASIYLSAQNLMTITNYKGLDPENMSTAALPPLKMVTIGFRVGF